jgi:hypothetical protein
MIESAKRPFIDFSRPQRFGPRAEYRQQENERVRESATLAKKFRSLKSLKVELLQTRSQWTSGGKELKYAVNVAHAKSVLRFDCINSECVGGDFDLSNTLAEAIRARQAIVTGEMCCQGWSSKDTINTLRCDCLLHYKLSLKFSLPAIRAQSVRN